MVIYEEISGTDLVRAYSNNNMLIRQDETGYLYSEAIDPNYMGRTYTETDIPIEADYFNEPAEENPNPTPGPEDETTVGNE